MTRRDVVMWAGLAVVLAAAAVLSFHALRDLAVAAGIPARLAWLLPIAVDAGAAVSCATWLSRRAPADAARVARGMTWALLACTVAGNAAVQGMHAAAVVPPWWVAVVVGAIPPAVVGGTVHLAVLVGRGSPRPVDVAAAEETAEPGATLDVAPATARPLAVVPPAGEQAGDDVDGRAAALVAEGAGRRRIARELEITEHEARQLLARLRDRVAS